MTLECQNIRRESSENSTLWINYTIEFDQSDNRLHHRPFLLVHVLQCTVV